MITNTEEQEIEMFDTNRADQAQRIDPIFKKICSLFTETSQSSPAVHISSVISALGYITTLTEKSLQVVYSLILHND